MQEIPITQNIPLWDQITKQILRCRWNVGGNENWGKTLHCENDLRQTVYPMKYVHVLSSLILLQLYHQLLWTRLIHLSILINIAPLALLQSCDSHCAKREPGRIWVNSTKARTDYLYLVMHARWEPHLVITATLDAQKTTGAAIAKFNAYCKVRNIFFKVSLACNYWIYSFDVMEIRRN